MPIVAPIRETVLDPTQRFTAIWQKFFLSVQKMEARIDSLDVLTSMGSDGGSGNSIPVYITDLAANKAAYPVASYPVLSIYYASDWLVYWINDGTNWTYLSGTFQAALSALPVTLVAADVGFRFRATDYKHEWIWQGGAWDFADGDASNYMVFVPVAATPPIGGLWQICDGSTVNVAKADATTVSVTVPTMLTNPFIKAGAVALIANDIGTVAPIGNHDSIGWDLYLRR